ncbi:hypothetical protein C7476_10422 [Phyllobacterium bourgognense]|uniref:Uncharacterized protein n=1 Tax=Phyllobacterium bourgognense TaxID=314236 RepID=A0A368YVP8_9HYPH|nr:hypothetical protein C7476_10422 [Phyllobacterium bourgognense]
MGSHKWQIACVTGQFRDRHQYNLGLLLTQLPHAPALELIDETF